MLVGLIDEKQVMFGQISSVALNTKQLIFQIHRHVDQSYLGLGYGEEMLAVMAKLAQINGGNIVIIPWIGSVESDHAVSSVKSMIRVRKGIEAIPICILHIQGMRKPMMFERQNIDNTIKDLMDAGIYIDKKKIKKLKQTCQKVDLSQSVYNFDEMQYSVGYMIKNIDAKISIPVQLRVEEDNISRSENVEKSKRAKDVRYLRNPELKEKDETEERERIEYLDKRNIENMLYNAKKRPGSFVNLYCLGENAYTEREDLFNKAIEDLFTLIESDSFLLEYFGKLISRFDQLSRYKPRYDEVVARQSEIA